MAGRSDRVTRTLLLTGAAAGPLFVATFLIEGATRDNYDSLRHPVSSLALGPGGWRQVGNFAMAGSLYLTGAVGLIRAEARLPDHGPRAVSIGPVLIGAGALGLLGASAFVTDPISGYPCGTPDVPASRTTSGALHDLLSLPTFLGIPTAALLYTRRALHDGHPWWAAYSGASAISMLAATALATLAFSQRPSMVAHGGVLQRTAVSIGFAWLTALHLRATR